MRSIAELEERLSRPSEALVDDLRRLDGDIMILGAGGKLGPEPGTPGAAGTRRGGHRRADLAVSRFSEPGLADALQDEGATVVGPTWPTRRRWAALPDAANVVFLVGAKFGTSGREHATWATNAYLPGRVAARFAGRADRRAAPPATSTRWCRSPRGGVHRADPTGPVGDYAMSCLGRERVLTHFAERDGTPLALIRLNYAVELRYGVLVDLARAVHARRADRPDHRARQRGLAGVRERGHAARAAARATPAVRAQRHRARRRLASVGSRRGSARCWARAGVHRHRGADRAAVERAAHATACSATRTLPLGTLIDAHRRLGRRRAARCWASRPSSSAGTAGSDAQPLTDACRAEARSAAGAAW